MKSRLMLPAFLLMTFSAMPPLHSAEPLRILCVGDSITQGGKADRPEYTYRHPLQQNLHALGIAFDFIGTRRQGLQPDATWPEIAPGVPFDPDHEGYYGNKTAAVVRKVIAAWPSDSALPDVVLVHLGTNDQNSTDLTAEVQAPLRDFIVFLRSKNPRVRVLLGHLNFHNSAGATALRPLVNTLAAELDTAESPVRTVAHYEGWNDKPGEPDSDTFDWAHPNPQGQKKMAAHWLAAIQSLPDR